jgi:hypothetical protein
MSFLSWFGRKEAKPDSLAEPSSDLGQVDITVPIHRDLHAPMQHDRNADAASRKSERLERRELLYGVVRECMTAAGVLSSSYKFKVLSLDSGGRKYLIMVDLPRDFLSQTAYFAETEGAIARAAKERYELLVTAVYWRVNEQVTAAGQTAAPANPNAAQAKGRADSVANSAPEQSPYAPLLQEEVLAFKRAVAAAAHGAAAHVEARKPSRQPTEHVADFSNTEPFEAMPPLGPSQFGGLN